MVVADVPTGPKTPSSTVLTIEEEAVARSSLHRCPQRRGISRLPEAEGVKTAKTKFKGNPVGFVHIDIAEAPTAESKLYCRASGDDRHFSL
jgi:hypothetical protein